MHQQGHLPIIRSLLRDRRTHYAAAIIVIAAVLFWIFRPTVDKDAAGFVRALLARDWKTAYAFESEGEREASGWDEPTFSRFCDTLSEQGWPTGLRAQIDEQMPIVYQRKPGEIGIDDSWNRAGTREYSVTLFRGDTSIQQFQVQFRHGSDGQWHPDVVGSLIKLTISNKSRVKSPQLLLLQALEAVHCQELTVFPVGDHTSPDLLRSYLAGTSEFWILPGVEPLR